MNRVYVLFHNPNDDKAGRLNQCLKNKSALVDHEKKVAAVQFPDGWLIVCHDEEPGLEMTTVIVEKSNGVQQPPRQILIVHKTSWDKDPNLRRAQQELTSNGNILSQAGRIKYYSHENGNPVYEELIKLLTHSSLEELDSALEKSDRKTLVADFSKLKHSIGGILSALDIDLQGLVASNFSDEYKREVAAAYQAEPETLSLRIVIEVKGASHVGEREDVVSASAVIPMPGKAIGFLEQARGMIHADAFSIRTLKEEVLQSTKTDTARKQEIESKWSEVEKLLPKASHNPDAIYQILRRMEIAEGLDELAGQLNPARPWDRVFHEWFYSLDDALNGLRDTMTAPVGKTLDAGQSDPANLSSQLDVKEA
jgi:hypothetical protein